MPQQQTSFYGRDQKNPFSLYPKDDKSAVREIGVWSGWGSGDADGIWVVKGIKLTWASNEVQHVYNHPKNDDTYSQYEFKQGESADWSIHAGWRINQLVFDTSTEAHWDAGAQGGDTFSHVANGILIGFEGSASWEVDGLSIRYDPKQNDNYCEYQRDLQYNASLIKEIEISH